MNADEPRTTSLGLRIYSTTLDMNVPPDDFPSRMISRYLIVAYAVQYGSRVPDTTLGAVSEFRAVGRGGVACDLQLPGAGWWVRVSVNSPPTPLPSFPPNDCNTTQTLSQHPLLRVKSSIVAFKQLLPTSSRKEHATEIVQV